MDESDKLDQHIINKGVGEWQDFELTYLQEEDSLNIRCEHFSVLTFCRVLFWTVDWLFAVWLKCASSAEIRTAAFQLRFTKNIVQK